MKDGDRAQRAAWTAKQVIPHEPAIRRWLARSRVPQDQIDDFIQEAYCKFSALPSVEYIVRPDAYFFQMVRNLLIQQARQSSIVNIEIFTEIDELPVLSDETSPERIVAARQELAEVLRLIGTLPGRCRQVFKMRKIEGLSQKEIARQLGITEAIVENDVVKGMRLISLALRPGSAIEVARRTLSNVTRINGQARNRTRD